MKLYTRGGDAGQTSLLGPGRVSKADLRVEAYGSLDELNAHIGLIALEAPESHQPLLRKVQEWLFTLGSHLAAGRTEKPVPLPAFPEDSVTMLERSIDEMMAAVPPMRYFILPGSCLLEAHVQIARTVCRRAERRVVALHEAEPVPAVFLTFLNRLSDWLFAYGRYLTHQLGVEEIPWRPEK
jgi:cob(I)alamin adenosyltransferase